MTPQEQRISVLHDLRSRFAVIQACTEMLVDPSRTLGSAQRSALIDMARDNASRLNLLVDEIEVG